jgi:gliding motility-associated-like protein
VIINPDVVIYIPNAFSPNANGVNDRFTINGTGITAQQMRIYDRWGELLYYTEDIDSGWDGTIQRNGDKAKQDMYVYTITVLDLVKAEHKFYGYVMLLR